jgi:hypothetical protein
LGQTAARHTTEEFMAFLGQIAALQPKAREVNIIADNLSAHETKRVAQFLADHPKVHLHFTPTYSSWLNQVELWFGRIERDVVARGVFACQRLGAQAHALYPSSQPTCRAHQMGLPRLLTQNHRYF